MNLEQEFWLIGTFSQEKRLEATVAQDSKCPLCERSSSAAVSRAQPSRRCYSPPGLRSEYQDVDQDYKWMDIGGLSGMEPNH